MPFSVHDGLPLDLPEKLLRFVTQQQEQITRQQEQIIQLQGQVEALEAEICRLKKLPPKPDIKPNTKPPGEGTGAGQPEGNDDNGLFPRLTDLIEKASRVLPCGLCSSY